MAALLLLAQFAAAQSPTIRITIDDTAVRELIALAEVRESSDARIDRWLDLPANKNLIRVGAAEGSLTRERLRSNAVAVIQGSATEASQPRGEPGRVLLQDRASYTRMLDALRASGPARIPLIAAHVARFSPPKTDVATTVYLHLGGDWDAINYQGAIYLNLHFWHDYFKPGWDGLNLVIAHETMHSVQNAAYGNPEEQNDPDGTWLTALSKLQREGTARYVEVETDPGPYEPYTYGFHYRAVASEALRGFGADLPRLQRLYDACYPRFDKAAFVRAYQEGMSGGGPYYAIGHGIARAIDDKLGRAALIESVERGPKDFFTKYLTLCARDPALPKLPADVAAQITRMPERL